MTVDNQDLNEESLMISIKALENLKKDLGVSLTKRIPLEEQSLYERKIDA